MPERLETFVPNISDDKDFDGELAGSAATMGTTTIVCVEGTGVPLPLPAPPLPAGDVASAFRFVALGAALGAVFVAELVAEPAVELVAELVLAPVRSPTVCAVPTTRAGVTDTVFGGAAFAG